MMMSYSSNDVGKKTIEKIQQKLHEQLKKIKEKSLNFTDFLEVQLDIENELYRPYMKPNSTPV